MDLDKSIEHLVLKNPQKGYIKLIFLSLVIAKSGDFAQRSKGSHFDRVPFRDDEKSHK
jgi:hypothetical protein